MFVYNSKKKCIFARAFLKKCASKYTFVVNAPLPPLILEGESDTINSLSQSTPTNNVMSPSTPPLAIERHADNLESMQVAGLTNSPSKFRGGRGALPTPTEHVMNTKEMKYLRRNLRTNGTPAEGAMWNILKGKKIGGLQFRRQYSVGTHILDFYCPALKLAIELDGDYHYYGRMPENDMARDQELLQKYHIRTLRFENKVVFHDPQAIINSILQIQEERSL